MKKAFTLIELLVTSTIIMIMLGVTITYSQKGESINKVNRAMERLSFDMRRISNLSMQTRQIGEQKICGWGVYFDSEQDDKYIIFSDFCDPNTARGDKMYSENEIQETMKLNTGIYIKGTNMSYVMYFPPEPRVEIYDIYNNRANEGNVVLSARNGNFSKTLTINQLGRVDVSN
jgi:type II secretory pathway pseudopilin PulG